MGLRIQTTGLTLDIRFSVPRFSVLDSIYEDWVSCRVHLIVPGFTGDITAQLELADFRGFVSSLKQMRSKIGEPSMAALCGIEPGICIEFKSDNLGHILVAMNLYTNGP